MLAAWRYPRMTGDPSRDRHATSIHFGCIALSVAFATLIVRSVGWRDGDSLTPMAVGELSALGALLLNYYGKWTWAVRLLSFGIFFFSTSLVIAAHDGFRSIAMLLFPGLLLLAIMLLRGVDYFVVTFATLLTVTGLGVAEIHSLIPTVPIVRTPTDYLTVFFVDLILLVIAFLGGLLSRDTRLNLKELRATIDQLATANRNLAQSETKYRSFVELAVDAIFVVDRDGVILEVNRQASVLSGLPREQLLGAFMKNLLSAAESGENPLPLDVLAQCVPIMRPCRIFRPDGTVVEVEIHSAMLPEGPILCFCRDITERERAGEEHKQLQAQLIHAQKMESIGRLAGGVAHDFNNLLTVINGYSHMLLDAASPDDPDRKRLQEIYRAGERAAALTQQLLAFSRKQILQPRALDFNRVVREVQPMLTRLVGEDIEVTVKLHSTAATVYADPSQLEQVIMNLAVNARDAMPGGGRLCIETGVVEHAERDSRSHAVRRPGSWVVLTVSDEGVGIDEAIRCQIFEPFFTTKKSGTGTGLGLSMIQGIIEQSGGYIEVDSMPGQGATFRIFLPAVTDAFANAAGTGKSVVPAHEGEETVLVVEDEAEVREYTAEALRSYGYRVIQAASADEALQICEREQGAIDLVLTDVVMPNVSGGELAERLAKRWPGLKVLFMSGYTDDAMMRHGVMRKGTQMIQKPFSPGQLADRIRGLLAALASAPRILVVDDQSAVRLFLRTILEQEGYQVVEAADGREAISQVRAGGVDLVITDLVMPVQEGLETIVTLRGEASGIGIIAISGALGGAYLEAAAGLGAHSVLEKPVKAGLLLERVAELLKSRQ